MRKIKTASFNLTNEYEKKLLAYAESKQHGDYSQYVKRLIGRDMEGRNRPPVVAAELSTPSIKPAVKVTTNFSGFI